MEDLLVHNFEIQSHTGPYSVEFVENITDDKLLQNLGTHYLIDKNVFMKMGQAEHLQLGMRQILLVDADEKTKSYLGIEPFIKGLINQEMRRDSKLVAIGGGIIQDITCFIANNFMRGIPWTFVPTTLLAQADSCIGSKSSINFGNHKNLLGSFTPPDRVIISSKFLDTLETKDFKSGVGEIIKLLLIGGRLTEPGEINRANVNQYVYDALQIKKKFIEEDEFDKGVRNILNYGHCFGHAIETATDYLIPHGIAITIGMDIANRLSLNLQSIDQDKFDGMHQVLVDNYKDYQGIGISKQKIFEAITTDKKNTSSHINVILPVGESFEKKGFSYSGTFWDMASKALEQTPIIVRS